MRLPRWTYRFLSQERQTKVACQGIRENMLFFGYDLSDLTDEELIDSAVRTAGIVGQTGVTCKQAADAMTRVGEAARKAGDKSNILKAMEKRDES